MKNIQSSKVVNKALNVKLMTSLIISFLLFALAITGVITSFIPKGQANLNYETKQGTTKNESVDLSAETFTTLPTNWQSLYSELTGNKASSMYKLIFDYSTTNYNMSGYQNKGVLPGTPISVYVKEYDGIYIGGSEYSSNYYHMYDVMFIYAGQIFAPSNCNSLFNLAEDYDYSYYDKESGETYSDSEYHSFIEQIILNNFDTSNVMNMSFMFCEDKKLESLDLSNFDTSNVTDMSSMFYNCSGLTNLDVSNFNASKVTSMSYMFYNCGSLTSLDLSNFDMLKVNSANNMINRCTSLTEIATPVNILSSMNILLPSTNVSGISVVWRDINNGYSITSSIPTNDSDSHMIAVMDLKNVNVNPRGTNDKGRFVYCMQMPGPDTPGATFMNNNFSVELRNSKIATLSDLFVEYYKYDGYDYVDTVYMMSLDKSLLFSGFRNSVDGSIYKLTDCLTVVDGMTLTAEWKDAYLTFPTNWELEISQDSYSSSYGVSNMVDPIARNDIKKIQFVTTISSKYKQIGQLSTGIAVYINKNDTSDIAFVWDGTIVAPTDCSALFSEKGINNIQSLVFSNFDTSNVSTMQSMFSDLEYLSTLNLTAFNTNNVLDMNNMFQGCSALVSINFGSNFNTSNVINMNAMFESCEKLTNINLSNFDVSKVSDMKFMFNGCSSLTNLDLDSFNCKNVVDMGFMFSYCTSLINLDLSSFNTNNVTNMESLFYECNKMETLIVNSFNTSNVTNMKGMFYSCYKLTNLYLTNFDTSKVTNMSDMFNYCSGLKNLDISSFNMINVVKATNMFVDCDSLIQIKIPTNVKILINLPKTMYDYGDYSTWSSLPIDESSSRTLNSTAPTFDITLNDSGDGIINSTSYILNETEQSLNISTPSCIGYSFNGWTVDWSDDIHSATLPTILGETLTIPANCYGNIRITANYSANVYSNILYYDINGGSNGPNAQIENVTYQDIVDVCQNIELDTIFLLKGRNE